MATAILCLLLVSSPAIARADRPTSGDMSVISGRTMGNGEIVLAAGVGWPGFWALAQFAPTSSFNLGLRGDVLWGSPIMGTGVGIGGSFSVPMRIHLFGQGITDLALSIRPELAIGDGELVGAEGVFSDDLGYAILGEVGARLGIHPTEAVTVAAGLLTSFGWVNVPDGDDASGVVGTISGLIGVEGLMSRDTMLFAELIAGGGYIAPDGFFDQQVVIRISLGIAYLL